MGSHHEIGGQNHGKQSLSEACTGSSTGSGPNVHGATFEHCGVDASGDWTDGDRLISGLLDLRWLRIRYRGLSTAR